MTRVTKRFNQRSAQLDDQISKTTDKGNMRHTRVLPHERRKRGDQFRVESRRSADDAL